MQIVKDVASVIGLIISCITLLTLFSTNGKKFLASIFQKYNKEQDNDIQQLKSLLEKVDAKLDKHIEDDLQIKTSLGDTVHVLIEFTRQQCRDIVKDMFYKYYDTKVLPLYEHKTLIYIEDIYINRLNGNSYASELINEMKTWQIDYKSRIEEE